MRCTNCEAENPEKKRFCHECGGKLLQTCSQCGSDSLPDDKFCGECGKKLGDHGTGEKMQPICKVLSMKKRSAMRFGLSELRADSVRKEMAIENANSNGSCRTIAICNQKGGVGKTVTAINLSARFAASGLRTLLVDLDPQGQSGLGLGLDVDALDRSIHDVLLNGTCRAREAIIPVRPNLEILPSNIDLALAELELARLEKRETRVREVIDGLRESYEYVVIDCPPSIGILTVNALVASQLVLVPVTPSSLSVYGLSKVIAIADALNHSFGLDARIFSFFTFFEKRLKETDLQRQKIERTFGQHLLKTVVRKNTKLNEATRAGVSIFQYSKRCAGARDYSGLAEEIMSVGSGEKSGDVAEIEREFYGKSVSSVF